MVSQRTCTHELKVEAVKLVTGRAAPPLSGSRGGCSRTCIRPVASCEPAVDFISLSRFRFGLVPRARVLPSARPPPGKNLW
jgi:hypothetical protein